MTVLELHKELEDLISQGKSAVNVSTLSDDGWFCERVKKVQLVTLRDESGEIVVIGDF